MIAGEYERKREREKLLGRIFLPDKNKIKDSESGIIMIFIICNLKLLTSLSGIWWSQHGNELEKQEMHTDF